MKSWKDFTDNEQISNIPTCVGNPITYIKYISDHGEKLWEASRINFNCHINMSKFVSV